MKKFITICVPTFNSQKYLNECLESISSNTNNFEYINQIYFCDNCSTDNTLRIIDSFINSNNIGKIISYKDYGQSDAINKAIIITNSQYFMWLNSDDILHSDFFVNVYKVIKNKPNYEYFTISADILHIDSTSNFIYRGPCMNDTKFAVNNGIWFGSFPCRIFLTKILKNNLLSNKYIYAMDFELIYRISNIDLPNNIIFSININKFLGFFRHHNDSKTTSGKYLDEIKKESDSIIIKNTRLSIILRCLNIYYLYKRFFKPYKIK